MAGIGFELRRLLKDESPANLLKAYGYSAVISGGPWLLSVLCLGTLNLAAGNAADATEMGLFRVLVIYCYAFSLIVVGSFQMPVTRYVADKLYARDEKALLPAFLTSALWVGTFQWASGTAILAFVDAPPLCRIYACALYVLISLIWHAMIFLSAARDYLEIVKAFAVGALSSVVFAWAMGARWGLPGFLAGFATGHAVTWVLLVARALAEFESGARLFDREVLGALGKFPELVGIGLFYNLGIWADKLVFWYGGPGAASLSFLRTYDPYDSAMLLAGLSTLPAFSIFLVRVETGFYEAYRDLYGAILMKHGWSAVAARHRDLGDALAGGIGAILKWQGAATLLCLLFAEDLAVLAHLPASSLGILRIGMLGAFLQAVFLVLLIFILYLDLRKEAFLLSVLFCLLSAGLTLLTLRLGEPFYGYGYAGACLLAAVCSYGVLVRGYRRLLFSTFTKQPVASPALD